MSFLSELKRRRLAQVGITYLIVAWGVAQVADLLFENFQLDDWYMQTLLVVLGLGCFIAIALDEYNMVLYPVQPIIHENLSLSLLAQGKADLPLEEIDNRPEFSNLCGDPRWNAFLARIGRTPEQLATIQFEATLPG